MVEQYQMVPKKSMETKLYIQGNEEVPHDEDADDNNADAACDVLNSAYCSRQFDGRRFARQM